MKNIVLLNTLARVSAAACGFFVALLAVVIWVENQVADTTGGITTNTGVWPLVIASLVSAAVALACTHYEEKLDTE